MHGLKQIVGMVGFSFWLGLVGCGESGKDEVERTTGTIAGEVKWSGTWPETGQMLISLFVVAPWDPAYVPGPPVANRYLEKGETDTIAFTFETSPIAFGEYQALMIAWKDPDDLNPKSKMHVLSAYGTSVDQLASAQPIVLSTERPDWVDLTMPSMTLYPSAADMRMHYPSL